MAAAVAGEFFGDLRGVGGAALRALEIDDQVFPFFKAFGFQAVDYAGADGVEGGMVGDGGDGHFFHRRRSGGGRAGSGGGFLFGGRAGGQHGGGEKGAYGGGFCVHGGGFGADEKARL